MSHTPLTNIKVTNCVIRHLHSDEHSIFALWVYGSSGDLSDTEISYNEDMQASEDHETNIDTSNLEEINSESDSIENHIEDKEIEFNNESSDLNHETIDPNIHIEEEVKEEEVDIDLEEERKKKYFSYTLPTGNLLNDPIEVGSKYTESELHQKADELIYALETFGVKGKVRRINQGPVITLFEIEPDEGVRVNKLQIFLMIFQG